MRARDPGYAGNPRPRPTHRAERTALKSLRLVGFICVLSMALNVVLGVLLSNLFPLVRVQPALVQFSDRQFFKIEPMYKGTDAELKAREAFARRYVSNRETIDLVTDKERWEWLRDNSHAAVWEPFIKTMADQKVWANMERDNLTREVNILGSWMVADDPNRWQVEYERITRRGYEVAERIAWVATFHYGVIEGAASDAQLFDNPFRLRVDRYAISRKQTLEEGGPS
jgi:type IV secretory pathway component VirB8